MPDSSPRSSQEEPTRAGLIALLKQQLARESQGVISDVVDSRTNQGAQPMPVAAPLGRPVVEQLSQALRIAQQSDNRSGQPPGTSRPVSRSSGLREMLPFDLLPQFDTNGLDWMRLCACEALEEFAHAASIRGSLVQAQDREVFLVKALGRGTPDVSST